MRSKVKASKEKKLEECKIRKLIIRSFLFGSEGAESIFKSQIQLKAQRSGFELKEEKQETDMEFGPEAKRLRDKRNEVRCFDDSWWF